MTFEQIFAGRMLLMRIQRHISQAAWTGESVGLIPLFKTQGGKDAYWIVERLLVDLETEFAGKRDRQPKQVRRKLDRRADQQVTR